MFVEKLSMEDIKDYILNVDSKKMPFDNIKNQYDFKKMTNYKAEDGKIMFTVPVTTIHYNKKNSLVEDNLYYTNTCEKKFVISDYDFKDEEVFNLELGAQNLDWLKFMRSKFGVIYLAAYFEYRENQKNAILKNVVQKYDCTTELYKKELENNL